MIIDLCGGKPSKVVSVGEPKVSTRSYPLDLNRVETLVGMKVPSEQQLSILKKLGFRVENGRAFPPSWRPDISGEADLVEEIVRVTSLQSLVGTPMKKVTSGVPKPILTPIQRKERIARRKIASLGYNECVSYSFIEEYGATQFSSNGSIIRVDNPISIEMGYMRPDLLPSLLNAASRNQSRGYLDLKLFEVGAIFHGKEPGQQSIVASGLLTGFTNPRDPHSERRLLDPFDVKADALSTLEALGATNKYKIYRDVPNIWHPGRAGRVSLGPKNSLAIFGELHPKIIKSYGLKGTILAFTVFIENIPMKNKKNATRSALDTNDLQAVERDFSFVLDERIEASELKIASESVDTKLIECVTVFDEFSGEKAHQQLGDGMKSLAISVRLQPQEKTLTEKEIDEVTVKIIENVKDKTGGELRA
jgi:phenylalanyl-tRNA synthetase beta chain